MRINGLLMTVLISLGVAVAYDKVKHGAGMRKGV